MVPPDVLKLTMSAVAPPSMDLYGAISSFSAETIGPIIAHGDFVAQLVFHFDVRHAVHVGCCLADEEAEHFALRGELDERELNRLVGGERSAEWPAFASVFNGLVDAVDSCTEGGSCLPDPVFMNKSLGDGQTAAEWTENARFRRVYVR